MKKSDLRPIGTEFDYCFPPTMIGSGSDNSWTVFRYKVVEHAEVDDGGRFDWSETITPLSVAKRIPCEHMLHLGNQLIPVPPEEVLHALAPSWKRVADVWKFLQQQAKGFSMTWHPIASAPRDDTTRLLLWNGEKVFIGWWCTDRWEDDDLCSNCHSETHADPAPTHWMPLPQPPTQGDQT